VRKRISSLIILLIGLGLAYWFVRRLEWQAVGGHLRSMRIWPVLLAALLINLTLLVRSFRWQRFLAPIARVQLGNVFAATTIGFGSVFIFGRAGEIVRPMVLSLREPVQPSATFATIIVERVFDMAAVAMLFSFNLLFFTLPPDGSVDQGTLATLNRIGLVLTVLVLLGIAALIVFRLKTTWLLGLIERRTGRLPSRFMRAIVGFISHLSSGFSVLLDSRALVVSSIYTVLVWALVTGATWLVFVAFGLNLSLSATIFVLGFGLVGSLVPLPGGAAGAFHAAAAAGLIFLGIERNLAASIAIVLHFVAFGPPFILALFYLMRDGIGWRRLREMMTFTESSVTEAAPTSTSK
jgi:glycosyltransferase 2 family protein